MLIDGTGNMVGTPGYARGNVLRSAAVDIDIAMTYLIPPNGGANVVTSDMNICMSSQQSQQNYTDGSPMLQAPAGAAIALRYHENGHVTKTQTNPGKPGNSGTTYVYGTTNSQSSDTLMAVHRQWTSDGTGGDGRGTLIAKQNFDDGQCYIPTGTAKDIQRAAQFPTEQGSSGTVICQTDVSLPSNLSVGDVYTIYWVWDWPTLTTNTQEIYTTCMDIQIVDGSSSSTTSGSPGSSDTSDSSGVAAIDGAIQFATPSVWDNVAAATVVASGLAGTSAFVDDTGSTLAFTSGGNDATTVPAEASSTFDGPLPTAETTTDTEEPTFTVPQTTGPQSSTILPIPGSTASQVPAEESNTFQPSFTAPAATTSFGSPTQESSSEPSFTQTDGGSGFGHHSFGGSGGGFGGDSDTTSITTPDTAITSSTTPDDPVVTSDGLIVTVTEIDSVMETVVQTVTTGTTFEKRLGKPATPILTPFPSSSLTLPRRSGYGGAVSK